jgi:hypothetical protein
MQCGRPHAAPMPCWRDEDIAGLETTQSSYNEA